MAESVNGLAVGYGLLTYPLLPALYFTFLLLLANGTLRVTARTVQRRVQESMPRPSTAAGDPQDLARLVANFRRYKIRTYRHVYIIGDVLSIQAIISAVAFNVDHERSISAYKAFSSVLPIAMPLLTPRAIDFLCDVNVQIAIAWAFLRVVESFRVVDQTATVLVAHAASGFEGRSGSS